jgi:transposase
MNELIRNQEVSDLFRTLDPARIKEFQKIRHTRKKLKLLIFCANNSVISYLKQIDGLNFRQSEDNASDATLPHVNVSFLIDNETGEIILYRHLPGNVADVKTVCKMLKELNVNGPCQVEIVMDRGFYSASNISGMYNKGLSFILGTSTNLGYIKNYMDMSLSTIKDFEQYNAENDIYFKTFSHIWVCKINGKPEICTMFVHIYFDSNKCSAEKQLFGLRLDDSINAGLNPDTDTDEEQEKILDTFCRLHKNKNGSFKYIKNFDIIEEHIKYFGFFSLISNNERNAIKALTKYRSKEKIEKNFFYLNNILSDDTKNVYYDEALEGKLFVQCLSASLSSYIRKKLKYFKLHNTYSNCTLIKNLNRIKIYSFPGEKTFYNEISLKQADIFDKFEIQLPEEVAFEKN